MEFPNNLRKSVQYFRWGRIENCPLVILDIDLEQDVWFGIPLVVLLDQRREALAFWPGLRANPLSRENQARVVGNRSVHGVVELINSHAAFSDVHVPRCILLDAERERRVDALVSGSSLRSVYSATSAASQAFARAMAAGNKWLCLAKKNFSACNKS
jgi:hypothetical protein